MNSVLGKVKIKGKIYSFSLTDNIINLVPHKLKDVYIDLFDNINNNKKNIQISFEGETNNGYYIKFINIKLRNRGRGCMDAFVPVYILGRENAISPLPKADNIEIIRFKGDVISKFYNYNEFVKYEKKANGKRSVTVNLDKSNKKIQFDNFYIEFKVLTKKSKKINEAVFDVESIMDVVFTKPISNTKILEIYLSVLKFYKFIYKRSFLKFSSVELMKKANVNYLDKIKKLPIFYNMYVANEKDVENDVYKESLTFSDIDDYFKNIFLKIINTTLELNYFKESYTKSLSIDQNRYMNLAMNFEKQFNVIHNDKFKSVTNNDYDEVKKLIISTIENIEVKGRGKKDYKQKFKQQIEKLEGIFEEKIRYSLSEYKECLIDIFNRRLKIDNVKNYKYDEIATTFSKTRNLIAHGEIIEGFSNKEIISFIILYQLLYCMILKSAGIEMVKIKDLLNEYPEF